MIAMDASKCHISEIFKAQMQVHRSRHSYSRIAMNPRGVIGKRNHMNVN